MPIQNFGNRDVLHRLIRKRDDGCAAILREIVYKIARHMQLLRVKQKAIVGVDFVDLFGAITEAAAKDSVQFIVIHAAFSFHVSPRSNDYVYIIIRIHWNCKYAKI